MSRFFHGQSSSESSSSEEEELYSDEDVAEKSEEEASEADKSDNSDSDSDGEEKPTGASRFIKDAAESDDSSDEEGRKVVKSAKDKRLEELEGTIKLIENAEKINDWAVISAEFDKLNRQVPKLAQSGTTPKMYIKAIADLEDFMNEALAKQKVSLKKMNATNARGLNAVKQRIKKNNKDFTQEIEMYREDKAGFMMSDEEDEAPPVEKPKKVKNEYRAVFEDGGDEEGFSTVGKGGKALQYTAEGILKHLRIVMESRGKKNTDRSEQIRVMEKLSEVAITPYQKIRVLLALISTRFDLTAGSVSYMSQEHWRLAEQEFATLLEVLESNPNMVVLENAEEWEDDEKPPTPAAGEVLRIPGSIVSLVERLDDELTRSLQHIDPHTAEYIERLADEGALYTKIVRSMAYIENLSKDTKLGISQETTNRIIMRRLEHVYFKPSQVMNIMEENTWKALPETLKSEITPKAAADIITLIHTLCTYLYQNSEGIIRARAMLCHIYFLALHDQYYRARDMMLMSHLQETISNFDVNTQILFNRTLVQVGLCAFRAGLINEAQNSLQEICGSGRQKELLAQGVMIECILTITFKKEPEKCQ